jgi:CHAT domain-containing protein
MTALALAASAVLADASAEISAAVEQARALRRAGKHAEALRLAEATLQRARVDGDPATLFRATAEVGDSRFYSLDYAGATTAFTEALAIAERSGDRRGQAGQHKNLGISWAVRGRLDLALAHLHLAVELAERYLPNGVSRSTHANLGTVYQRLGARNLAIRAFRQALAPGPEPLTAEAELDARTRIGSLYLDAGEPAAALPELRAALAAAGRGTFSVEESYVLGYLVPTQMAVGDLEGALASVRRQVELDRSLEYGPPLRLGLVRLGDLQRSNPSAARKAYEEAAAIQTDKGMQWIWLPKARLARLAAEEGDRDRALAGYEAAAGDFEQFITKLDREEALAHLAGHRNMYEEWMSALLPPSHPPSADDLASAITILERARGASVGWKPARSAEDDAALLALRRREAADRLARLRAGESEPGDVHREEIERLELEVWRLQREAADRAGTVPEHVLSRVRDRLDPSEALLAYFALRDEMLVFTITSRGASLERLPVSDRDLNLRVEALLARLSAPSGEAWQGVARRLYRDLVAAALDDLPAGVQTLTIVTDSSLTGLPFEVLGDTDQPLISRYAIAYAEGVSEWLADRLEERTSTPSGRLLVLNPGPAAALQAEGHGMRALYREEGFTGTPLMHADSEVQAIREALGGRAQIWRGDEARESALSREKLSGFSALHFTTHGMVSRWSPWRSALLLAAGGEDGLLQAREIAERMPPAQLVVLAACRTAVGQPRAGREILSLAEAFRLAGARTVVASVWDVDDASTARLFAAFYRELGGGAHPADALRRAKLSLRADPATAAPRHWAGFVLYGDGMTPVRFLEGEKARDGVLPLVVAILFVAGLLGVRWRSHRSGTGRTS